MTGYLEEAAELVDANGNLVATVYRHFNERGECDDIFQVPAGCEPKYGWPWKFTGCPVDDDNDDSDNN